MKQVHYPQNMLLEIMLAQSRGNASMFQGHTLLTP